MSDKLIFKSKQKEKGGFWEFARTIFFALLLALFVRSVAYEPFSIPSGSMLPNLLINDYLFVSKFSYGYSRHSLPFSMPLIEGRVFSDAPERGDIAVFKLPRDNRTDYIKRVIGLPGDTIEMKAGFLFINGKQVPRKRIEDYVYKNTYGNSQRVPQYIETLPNGHQYHIIEERDNGPLDNTIEYTVPEGHYFMMGDNRDNSIDSRVLARVGYVPFENYVGRASFVFFSLDDSFWKFWKWPWSARWNRFFKGINNTAEY